MRLKRLELTGFKSFAKKTEFLFEAPITAIVGPNGSGKSNATEAFRWVLGERSLKSLRSGRGEDLIWNGGPHSNSPRASRGAVSLIFDNRDRHFSLDFEEVQLTREVFRDGTNVYSINGTPVRYRDLVELLAGSSLASSEHFIINQGEADRVLLANPGERRTLVEDALGLRLYQWKIDESEKKLEQTKQNLEQVASLRREIAPHLKFLKKQMEKIEQADVLRRELKALYLEYLKREEVYLQKEAAEIGSAQKPIRAELVNLEKKLGGGQSTDNQQEKAARERIEQTREVEKRLLAEKEELTRQLGRLEGKLELKQETRQVYSAAEVGDWAKSLQSEIDAANRLSDIFSLKGALERLKQLVSGFLSSGRPADLGDLERERTLRLSAIEAREQKLTQLKVEKEKAEQELTAGLEQSRAQLTETFALKTRRHDLLAELNLSASRRSKLDLEQDNFARELAEAKVLVDQEIILYKNFVLPVENEPRTAQEDRRKKLERLKIKLEDLGVESGETMKEYQAVGERDAFLAREITDLETAATSLRGIIAELAEKIDHEFRAGLEKVNHHFQDFFALMFGGGTAALTALKPRTVLKDAQGQSLERESLEVEEREETGGLEIKVNLPRKKIRGLDMLSGGERALVSIALLFALSQVNPPPFLVLDETDAALDEANSRRYGEMVENLAKQSQLVLVTHNRETMSHAGVIYGVTMGTDGISKLLSIKFDEAAQFAK